MGSRFGVEVLDTMPSLPREWRSDSSENNMSRIAGPTLWKSLPGSRLHGDEYKVLQHLYFCSTIAVIRLFTGQTVRRGGPLRVLTLLHMENAVFELADLPRDVLRINEQRCDLDASTASKPRACAKGSSLTHLLTIYNKG